MPTQEPKLLSFEAVIELSLKDPIIHDYVASWRAGNMTQQEALIGCVLALQLVKENQFELLRKYAEHYGTIPHA